MVIGAFEREVKDYEAVLDTMGGGVQEKSFEVTGGILVSIAQAPDPGRAQAHHARTLVLSAAGRP